MNVEFEIHSFAPGIQKEIAAPSNALKPYLYFFFLYYKIQQVGSVGCLQHLFMFYFALKWIVVQYKIYFVFYAFPDCFQL